MEQRDRDYPRPSDKKGPPPTGRVTAEGEPLSRREGDDTPNRQQSSNYGVMNDIQKLITSLKGMCLIDVTEVSSGYVPSHQPLDIGPWFRTDIIGENGGIIWIARRW